MKCSVVFAAVLLLTPLKLHGQAAPSAEENIPFLITFGKNAGTSWGDYDYSQIFFFVVPETYKGAVHIRVFDPDTGGANDELNGAFDSRMQYSVYGGKDAYTHPDVQEIHPKRNYKTGNLLTARSFGADPRADSKWYTFGPFNPTEGEHYPQYRGYIFKMVCEGVSGDDGNMYRYFMSTSATENIPVEGGYVFTFQYTFRLHDNAKEVSHIYPYVDGEVTSIKTENFDWDDDGNIRVTSEVRREQPLAVSGDDVWAVTEFAIMEGEKGKSLDFQFIKRGVRNNNVVINVRNQRGELMQFHCSPIGGIPRYRYTIEARKK